MSQLTLDDLRAIMIEAAGDDDAVDLTLDILDTPFTELGFDSLAMLETVTLVKRRTGVAIADDELDSVGTPRALLTKVNTSLEQAA
ncbi:MAG: acyl carrier protein [Pseudonocardia sp.]|nr:acyl carrier protein [Pseudonocardia sp.]